MNKESEGEHIKRVDIGEKTRNFLVSEEWLNLVKPILDSMLIGLKDATTIDVSSDKKAAIEVKSRTLAAKYIQEIETLLEGHVANGDLSKKILERAVSVNELYKVNE